MVYISAAVSSWSKAERNGDGLTKAQMTDITQCQLRIRYRENRIREKMQLRQHQLVTRITCALNHAKEK